MADIDKHVQRNDELSDSDDDDDRRHQDIDDRRSHEDEDRYPARTTRSYMTGGRSRYPRRETASIHRDRHHDNMDVEGESSENEEKDEPNLNDKKEEKVNTIVAEKPAGSVPPAAQAVVDGVSAQGDVYF